MYHDQGAILDVNIVAELLGIALALDLTPGPGGSRMSDYEPTLLAYHAYPPLRALFPNPWTLCTVIALEVGAQIPAHRDPPIAARRYHVVLQSNPGCWSFVEDGGWQQLDVGGIYRMDPALGHGAVNWGTERRLHLIIDETRR